MMPHRVPLRLPWLLGFFLVFNPYLLPASELAPRATDALGAALGLWLVWLFCSKGLPVRLFTALVVILLIGVVPLVWGLYAYNAASDLPTTVLSLRWLLAIPYAFALFLVALDPRQRTSVAWGLWWGCVANIVVLALQFYGLEQLTKDVGLAAQDTLESEYGEEYRAPGMHGHANGSTAIVSLLVPVSLYLYYVGKTRSWTVVVSLGLVSLATQLTYTRAALLVSLTVLLMVLVAHFRRSRSARLATLVVLVVLLTSLYVGLPGGTERWEDFNRIRENASVRLQTNAAALQISMEHPLGVGAESGVEMMRDKAANEATHDAYLQIAVMYGLALAGLLFLLIIILALQALNPTSTAWRLEPILALQVFGLFFWEEHLSNPSFMIMVNWLVVASAYLIAASLRRGAPHARRPPWQGVRETNNLSHL